MATAAPRAVPVAVAPSNFGTSNWRAMPGPSHLASAELTAFLREASLAELGASIITVTCQPAEGPLGVTMGSEPDAGARVCAIERGSRAELAGLRVGDRIVRVNSDDAKGAVEAKALIEACSHRGEIIQLDVVRARQIERVPTTCILERRVSEPQHVRRRANSARAYSARTAALGRR
mmetsp:Transcript_23778/g.39284  ORF Transcript_23778/g.39284 Transcript_23778/m.39284 type:complete len:177 (-) Transcript_23778:300-830(-)